MNSDTGRRRDRGTGGSRSVSPPPDLASSTPPPEWNKPQHGACGARTCGEEAACKQFRNNTHICICPHDSSPPTADLKCPNRYTVPLTPRPIHNIIPPSGNATTPRVNISTTMESVQLPNKISEHPDLVIIIAPIISIFVALILIGVFWRKLKFFAMCKGKNDRKIEGPQTGEPLLDNRYISNPQYSVTEYSVTSDVKDPKVPLLNRDALKFLEEIGEGCFGKVFKGELRIDHQTLNLVAIKVLKDNASRTAECDFIREVEIMSAFHHENILSLIGVVKANNSLNPWMVFEFMPYGDLAGVLRSKSMSMRETIAGLPDLDNKSLLTIALQVAQGMKYLASQRFVHRDLACRNCLVGDDLIVKIADFGMSRDVYTSDYYKMGGTRPMPIRWMSPESILYARFTLESDIWSYGVVLWEIYSLGKQPFYGHNNDGASKLIIQGIMLIPPDDCPTFICELMRACWRSDPKDRIKFEEVCEKLQLTYDNDAWDGSVASENESKVNDNDSWILGYDTIDKCSLESFVQPPLPTFEITQPSQADHVDPEGYLVPAVAEYRDYLKTLPD